MIRRLIFPLTVVVLSLLMSAGCTFQLNPKNLPADAVTLPVRKGGTNFNEIDFNAKLGRILVPAGGMGSLYLIDPTTKQVSAISGFSVQNTLGGAPGGGLTSVTSGRGLLFAVDRSALKLYVIDPEAGNIVASTSVLTKPDLVRFVAAADELWVTEPDLEQIEVFSLPPGIAPKPVHHSVIPVKSGPESLVIDEQRGLAYTNSPETGLTAVIQLITHNILMEWGNGCSQSRGLALDQKRGLLFIACGEGKVVVLDIGNGGLQVTSQNYGGDLDTISYNPGLQHLYLPSAASAILAVFAVTESGSADSTAASPQPAATSTTATRLAKITLTRLGTADTALHAHCVTVDNQNNVWVCDPDRGLLFRIKDSFPAGD